MYAYQGETQGKEAVRVLLGWRDGMFAFTTELEKLAPNLRAPLPVLLSEYRQSLPGVPKAPPPTGKQRKGPPPTGKQRKGPPPTGRPRKGPPRKGPPR